MNKGEIRSNTLSVPEATDSHVSGLAGVFYAPSIAGTAYRFQMETPKGEIVAVEERVMPTAFTRAVAEDDVMCLYNHRRILGRRTPGFDRNTLELSVVDQGLQYRSLLLPSQVELRENLQAGNIRGSSFQFKPRKVVWKKDGELRIRELHDVTLIDVAPVDRPAYAATSASLRSEERAALEEILREEVRGMDSLENAEQRNLELAAQFQFKIRALQLRNELRSDVVSYMDVYYVLKELVHRKTGLYPDRFEVYDGFCTFEHGFNPVVCFKQSYSVDESGKVSLVGEPMEVKEVYVPA